MNLTAEQVMAADVDGNGAVNATDALLILKKVVGKIDKFPVEGGTPSDDDTPPADKPSVDNSSDYDETVVSLRLPSVVSCNMDDCETVAQWLKIVGTYSSESDSYTYKSGNYSATWYRDGRILLNYDGFSMGQNFSTDIVMHSIHINTGKDQQEIWYDALRTCIGGAVNNSYLFIYSVPEKKWIGHYSNESNKLTAVRHAMSIFENTANWFDSLMNQYGLGVTIMDLGIKFEYQTIDSDTIVLEAKDY